MKDVTQVKFLDLQRLNSQYRDELVTATTRVIDSGWYILGKEVEAFEQQFADYCGAKHCIGVGNGLDALVLILKGYIELGQLSQGDKVLIPSNTFIATALAVSQAGLEPVLAAPNEATYNFAADGLGAELLSQVKAVIAVHLYGQLADAKALRSLCDEHDLLLIEDAAQSHGAELEGRRAGDFGHAAGFSCFPGKNLGALGDAGVIVTNSDELADTCRSIRNYGSKVKYQHELQGVNSRLDEIQAAMLSVKLKYLDQDIAKRRAISEKYRSGINNPLIQLPVVADESAHVWHLFVVRSGYREQLQAFLLEQGVQTLIHYPTAIAEQPAYLGQVESCSVAKSMSEEILSLPIDPTMTDDEIAYVIDACNKFEANS